MWIALGVMLLALDIVTSIDPEITQHVSRTKPDDLTNGVITYNEVEWVWYEVASIDNIFGVIFILGGLAQLGVIIYEKHRHNGI